MKIGNLLGRIPRQRAITLRQDGSVEAELKSGAKLRFPSVESFEENAEGVYALLPVEMKGKNLECQKP